jgi:hypothetical protein
MCTVSFIDRHEDSQECEGFPLKTASVGFTGMYCTWFPLYILQGGFTVVCRVSFIGVK